mmetsp:Transcript_37886/g.100823  ORF Transcript_37886/g.100823 Transcript_37886/m.100823 type:complete len:221 (-) Transcript_37886:414-1076(-)
MAKRVMRDLSKVSKRWGASDPKKDEAMTAAMLMRRKRMRKTLSTGTMELLRAWMIFLRDLTRPKRRMTRRARRMRTMPVGWLVTIRERIDMVTMKTSSQFQGSTMKGLHQWQNMLMASSAVKTSVNMVLSCSRVEPVAVLEPSSFCMLSMNWHSTTVHTKFAPMRKAMAAEKGVDRYTRRTRSCIFWKVVLASLRRRAALASCRSFLANLSRSSLVLQLM